MFLAAKFHFALHRSTRNASCTWISSAMWLAGACLIFVGCKSFISRLYCMIHTFVCHLYVCWPLRHTALRCKTVVAFQTGVYCTLSLWCLPVYSALACSSGLSSVYVDGQFIYSLIRISVMLTAVSSVDMMLLLILDYAQIGRFWWETNSADFCMTDGRFLLADFIGRRNRPTLSFVWHQLNRRLWELRDAL